MFGCCRHPDLVSVREEWAGAIHGTLSMASLPAEIRQAAMSMWKLEADGTIADWMQAEQEPFAASGWDGGPTTFAAAIHRARRGGPQRLWSGLLPRELIDAMSESTGVSSTVARKLARDLAAVGRDFLGRMWRARNAIVHDGSAGGDSRAKERDRVRTAVQHMCEGATDLPSGVANEIHNWPLRRQKAWLRSRTVANQRRLQNATMMAPRPYQTRFAVVRRREGTPQVPNASTHHTATQTNAAPTSAHEQLARLAVDGIQVPANEQRRTQLQTAPITRSGSAPQTTAADLEGPQVSEVCDPSPDGVRLAPQQSLLQRSTVGRRRRQPTRHRGTRVRERPPNTAPQETILAYFSRGNNRDKDREGVG